MTEQMAVDLLVVAFSLAAGFFFLAIVIAAKVGRNE